MTIQLTVNRDPLQTQAIEPAHGGLLGLQPGDSRSAAGRQAIVSDNRYTQQARYGLAVYGAERSTKTFVSHQDTALEIAAKCVTAVIKFESGYSDTTASWYTSANQPVCAIRLLAD